VTSDGLKDPAGKDPSSTGRQDGQFTRKRPVSSVMAMAMLSPTPMPWIETAVNVEWRRLERRAA
jgi:hypothetical protein